MYCTYVLCLWYVNVWRPSSFPSFQLSRNLVNKQLADARSIHPCSRVTNKFIMVVTLWAFFKRSPRSRPPSFFLTPTRDLNQKKSMKTSHPKFQGWHLTLPILQFWSPMFSHAIQSPSLTHPFTTPSNPHWDSPSFHCHSVDSILRVVKLLLRWRRRPPKRNQRYSNLGGLKMGALANNGGLKKVRSYKPDFLHIG